MALADRLAHYYTADEPSGDLLDVHGGLTLPKYGDPGSGPGIRGTARTRFDGEVDGGFYVEANPNVGSAFSISLWFRTQPEFGGYTHRVGNSVAFHAFETDTLTYIANGVNAVVGDATHDEWHHLVLIHDDETGEFSSYLDGEPGGTHTYDPGAVFGNPTHTWTGFLNGPGLNQYHGSQDEIAVFDGLLTPTEVAYLYNGGVGRTYAEVGPPPPAIRHSPSFTEPTLMTAIMGYEAQSRMLAELQTATAFDTLSLKLIGEGIVPSPATVVGDLVAPGYTGYAGVTVTTPGVIHLDLRGNAVLSFPEVAFQPDDDVTPALIYGWYLEGEILGTGVRLVTIEMFETPVSLNGPLDVLFVRPKVVLGQPR